MNCKPGDLARVVDDVHGVTHDTVPRPFTVHVRDRIVRVVALKEDGCWDLEQSFEAKCTGFELVGAVQVLAIDDILRPIRGGEGDDETLAWAGKPEQVAA